MRHVFFILCLALAACARPGSPILAIHNVSVIDVTNGSVHPNQTVLVAGDHIVKVAPTDEVRIPDSARLLDGTDGYLIPGLWDMHVHSMYEGRPELFFPMFVANGVTGVRELGSTFTLDRIRSIRGQIARKEVLGPRFGAVASKVFEGPVPPGDLGPEFMSISTQEEAREMVRAYKRQGADFIKVYHHLSREVYFAIIDEAKRHGLPVAGHVPEALKPGEASDAGQRSIEHLWDTPDECFASNADCDSLFARYARNETWQVPTLVVARARILPGDPEVLNDGRLKYIPLAKQDEWKAEMSRRQSRMSQETASARWHGGLKMVGVMHRAGVPMLAGTDTGLGNAYTFAGFSLHDELALLVEAGLTPLEALRAATIHPARFLNATDSLGTIQPEKLADLVLLDGNPLENIGNTRRIRAVISDGRLYRRADLDRLLAEVEAAAGR